MKKNKILLIGAFLFISFVGINMLTSLYPDYLWFESFGYKSLWFFIFKAQWLIFLSGFIVAYLFLSANINLAKKISGSSEKVTSKEFNTPFPSLNMFLKQVVENNLNKESGTMSLKVYNILLKVGVVVLSFFFGLVMKSWWQTIYAFLNQVPFGKVDPILNKDISFYFFTLPLLENIQNWLLMLIIISIGVIAWIYLSKNVLLTLFINQKKSSGIKPHIFILSGLLFLMISLGFYLDIYNLPFIQRGVVFGAGFTDHTITLWVYKAMMFLLIFQALICFLWAFKKGFKTPIFGLLIILMFFILSSRLVPSFVQKYIVSPNEFQKEKRYIKYNIDYTRFGFGLDKIKDQNFPADNNLNKKQINNNKITIDNIRLWNQEPLKQTFSQLQEIRLYYEFNQVDVDRYKVDGKLTQVMLSPREMDSLQLSTQAQTWINKHLVYTHGYGLCMSPVSEITKEGLPKFFIKDIPPQSSLDIQVERPEIYFSEKTNQYIIVNTNQKEFDYPKGDKNVYTNYNGDGGVKFDSLFKRFIFALKFSEIKILISSLINNESRIIYDRNIKKMVKKMTPFIAYDRDPYLVLTNEGRMVWVLDGYTLSRYFPYSEPFMSKINYIRNAVKVVIDAYDGTMNYYLVDKEDPIVQTYAAFYPNLFKSFEKMPEDIKDHLRYPKDLFTIQANVYSTYHMTDEQVFYNREDLWAIPSETYGESEQVMKAYYMVTRLPGESEESFIQMLPFTPTNKNNMIAWMSVKCDKKDYGEIVVYKFPKEKTIYGPMQIESRIDQDTDISQKLTLWGQVGSRVIRGNLMVVPIEQSLVYVEPIYLQATQSKLPELKRVIFAYDNSIVMSNTLNESLDETFSSNFAKNVSHLDTNNLKEEKSSKPLIDQIKSHYKKLKEAVKNVDWISFGDQMNRIDQLIEQASEKK